MSTTIEHKITEGHLNTEGTHDLIEVVLTIEVERVSSLASGWVTATGKVIASTSPAPRLGVTASAMVRPEALVA